MLRAGNGDRPPREPEHGAPVDLCQNALSQPWRAPLPARLVELEGPGDPVGCRGKSVRVGLEEQRRRAVRREQAPASVGRTGDVPGRGPRPRGRSPTSTTGRSTPSPTPMRAAAPSTATAAVTGDAPASSTCAGGPGQRDVLDPRRAHDVAVEHAWDRASGWRVSSPPPVRQLELLQARPSGPVSSRSDACQAPVAVRGDGAPAAAASRRRRPSRSGGARRAGSPLPAAPDRGGPRGVQRRGAPLRERLRPAVRDGPQLAGHRRAPCARAPARRARRTRARRCRARARAPAARRPRTGRPTSTSSQSDASSAAISARSVSRPKPGGGGHQHGAGDGRRGPGAVDARVQQVGLVERGQARLVAGAELVEHRSGPWRGARARARRRRPPPRPARRRG